MDTTYSNSSSELEDFQYDPFPSPEWIRLLQLNHTDTSSPATNVQVRVTLSTFPTSSAPAYAALSYTWGSSYLNDQMTADRTHPIICNDARVLATKNLSIALQSGMLRQKLGDNGYLWADAICLNQDDLSERAEQVARMSEIYKNASSVIIWLGPADANAAVAFPLIADMAPRLAKASGVSAARYNPELKCCYSYERADPLRWHYTHPILWSVLGRKPLTKSEEMALMGLLKRHWFERVWMIQEFVLAKGPVVVICGDDLCLAWDDLMPVCNWVVDSQLGHAYQEVVRRDSNLSLLALGVGPMLMEELKWAINTVSFSKIPSEMTREPGLSELIDKHFFASLLRLISRVRLYLSTDGRGKILVPMALAMHQFAPLLQPDSPAKQPLPNYLVCMKL
ncbi:Heterokaryon incompatibility protein (HET) domain containing protein [Rhypophila decipiens]